ncbi:MAG: succinate dehydrogenase/fumarate reductase iron-sulfur subunit [Epsilonproteobacteria bacterium]|nr:succinate dehydrogenase/fumarate reductase iron-sulfur subunit [Campylobacterota bacterium]
MKIKIKRDKEFSEFEVSSNLMLLEALFEIKQNIDSTLTFDSGCRSMVCGACSVRVNGKEVLACATKVNDGDEVEPLKYHKVIRDLKVDKSSKLQTIKREKAYLKEYKEVALTPEDEKLTERQSDCILCDSCYSACPVFEVNENFLGPFALTRAYRYAVDKRLKEPKEIIDNIQKDGIWDCTLCGECTLVCPKGIDPKGDIINLRNLSAQYGYMDPNFGNMDFGSGFSF